MIRPVFTEVVLFFTPFVLYAAFLWFTKAGVIDRTSWPLSRFLSLLIAALVLVAGSFIFFAHWSGAPVGTRYIPAHVEDGKFVPGRLQ